jgi:hypothetical protein
MDQRADEEGNALCGFGGDVSSDRSHRINWIQPNHHCRMIIVAVVLLNIFHPGKYLFRRKSRAPSSSEGVKSDV